MPSSLYIIDVGQVLSFPGGTIIHGGDPLLGGTRYIIAVFLLLEESDKSGMKTEKKEEINNQISKFLDIYKHSLSKNIEKINPESNKGIENNLVDNFHSNNDTSFNFDFSAFPLI
jgi:hypothetical protein